jgi:hypothetical protein
MTLLRRSILAGNVGVIGESSYYGYQPLQAGAGLTYVLPAPYALGRTATQMIMSHIQEVPERWTAGSHGSPPVSRTWIPRADLTPSRHAAPSSGFDAVSATR